MAPNSTLAKSTCRHTPYFNARHKLHSSEEKNKTYSHNDTEETISYARYVFVLGIY